MPEANVYLKINTEVFLNVWVNYLKKCEKENHEPAMDNFAELIADRVQKDPGNLNYIEMNGRFSGKDIESKVVNKCRSINTSLKKKYDGKKLPIPKRTTASARPKAHEILASLDGALDFLK